MRIDPLKDWNEGPEVNTYQFNKIVHVPLPLVNALYKSILLTLLIHSPVSGRISKRCMYKKRQSQHYRWKTFQKFIFFSVSPMKWECLLRHPKSLTDFLAILFNQYHFVGANVESVETVFEFIGINMKLVRTEFIS